MVDDPVHAFCDDAVHLDGAAGGRLAGLRFAAEDLFDVAGHVTGAGNPDWARTHDPAAATAPLVAALVAAGATLVGRTWCDELGISLLGVNPHFGTPVNPLAPDSVPGGAASGAASAVAAELVDFAVAVDTGGSVRVPAGLCGVYGYRASHGRASLEGTVTLAPSFDAAGWFARELAVLRQVALVLLGDDDAAGSLVPLSRVLVADDLFDAVDEPIVDALIRELERLAARLASEHVPMLAADGLGEWAAAHATLASAEIWATHRHWLETVNPTMSLDLRNRLDLMRQVTEPEVVRARAARDQVAAHLEALLGLDGVLVLPTNPEIAPLLHSDDAQFAEFQRRALELCCLAGLAGLPQITVPVARLAEYPVGLSLIGPRGADHALIALAATITRPA